MSGGPSSEATAELVDVTVRFGGLLALDRISFDVQANEIVGLIGPNGAGKTTAFNVICGFQKPDSGTVRFPALGRTALKPSNFARLALRALCRVLVSSSI